MLKAGIRLSGNQGLGGRGIRGSGTKDGPGYPDSRITALNNSDNTYYKGR